MQQNNTIEHSGIVQSIDRNGIDVKIISHPACMGCAASNICDVSGSNEKIIRVKSHANVRPGEKVTVLMSMSQGYRALMLGYILPFIIVLFALIILVSCGVSELISGLASLIFLACYYLVVYLRKEKIGKRFSFSLKTD